MTSSPLVLANGNVVTMDAAQPRAEAVAVRDGFVQAVGSLAEVRAAAGRGAETVDLAGRTVLPGLIESHVHPVFTGRTMGWADCRTPPRASIEDLLTALGDQAHRSVEPEWIRGWGYDDTLLADDRHPTRDDLDRVSSTRPVLISHISGHFAVANSAALHAAGIDAATPDPVNGRIVGDATGRPTGLLWELGAVNQVFAAVPAPRDAEVDEALLGALHLAAAQGITTLHDLGVGFSAGPAELAAYRRLDAAGRLPVRVFGFAVAEQLLPLLAAGEESWGGTSGGRFVLRGAKCWADGAIQGMTAALGSPYHCAPDLQGELLHAPGKLANLIAAVHDAGGQVAVHANGDRAVEAAVDAIESAMRARPRAEPRHRIEHCQVTSAEMLHRMARLGIEASFFINHVYWWGDRHADRFLGPERAADIDPLKWAQDAGLRFGVHSDCPITPMDPLRTLATCVRRSTSSGRTLGAAQQIDVHRALAALTTDAAYLVGAEDRLGRLAPGFAADLVVVSADPYRARGDELSEITVEQVMVAGAFVG